MHKLGRRGVATLVAVAAMLVFAPPAGAATPLTQQIYNCRNAVLREGSSGSCVTTEQTFLNDRRSMWHGTRLTVDGRDGSATTGQLHKFQTWAGITSDGVVGHDTWEVEADVQSQYCYANPGGSGC